MIPYGRQDIDRLDIEAVVDVLKSEWLTQGPAVDRFEQAVAAYCGSANAVSANSATSSLHLAYLALGLGRGDILWTSPNTFVATANAAVYCGASVDFVDIDPLTHNICPDALEEKLRGAAKDRSLPKIVVPVHYGGQSCEMRRLWELSREYGFRVVEDASHAIGGVYEGKPIGSCQYSDIAVFSFHPVKIITSGEGGMAVTNDRNLAERMRLLCSHGITRDPRLMSRASDGPWYYEQIELGFNYRMTDIHAALGRSQLMKVDEFVGRRRRLADRYDAALGALPIVLPARQPSALSAWHLYVITLKGQEVKARRRKVVEGMRQAGIFAHVHYIPVHLQPYYARLGFTEGICPEAEKFYESAVTLPIHARLNDEDQQQVVDRLATLLS